MTQDGGRILNYVRRQLSFDRRHSLRLSAQTKAPSYYASTLQLSSNRLTKNIVTRDLRHRESSEATYHSPHASRRARNATHSVSAVLLAATERQAFQPSAPVPRILTLCLGSDLMFCLMRQVRGSDRRRRKRVVGRERSSAQRMKRPEPEMAVIHGSETSEKPAATTNTAGRARGSPDMAVLSKDCIRNRMLGLHRAQHGDIGAKR